jgi:hypothetical protein
VAGGVRGTEELKGILLMHLVMGCAPTALIWAVWFIHRGTQPNQDEVLPGYRSLIEAVAVFIVALTGHLGGFLTGVNGPG